MSTDVQVTSQGEIIRSEAPVEAKKPLLLEDQPAVLLLEDQPTVLQIEDKPEVLQIKDAPHGVVDSLWNTVRSTTEAAAHMAEIAATTVKESASELIGKGFEKAHDAAIVAEHAGEKIVEQAKEIVFDLEHKAEDVADMAAKKFDASVDAIMHTAEEKKEQIVEQKNEIQAQAQTTLSNLTHKLQDLSEIIVEQSQQKASEFYDVAASLGEQAKEKAVELQASAQQLGEQALEKGTEAAQTTKSVGIDALEQVKSVGQQALATGQKALEEVKANTDSVVEQAKEASQSAVDQAKVRAEGVATQAKGMGQRALSAGENLMGKAKDAASQATLSKNMIKSASARFANMSDQGWNKQALILTMDVVSHLQRIADRTGDAVLHETARKAHSACAKGLNDAPGVHLVWITPQQANDLVNLAIRTQDHELADFARYCQSVAATTHVGVEPTPGKIQQEIMKGYQELQQQGRVHTGPGYGAAFASVNRTYPNADATSSTQPTQQPAVPAQKTLQTQKSFNSKAESTTPPQLALTMDVVSHIQRIADRTGNALLHDTARKAHSACAKGESDAEGVHLVWIAPQQASELMNLASKTQDQELIDFARYCQSVAATTQVGVEPTPGKIQEEILKGRQQLQKLQPAQQEKTPEAAQPAAI